MALFTCYCPDTDTLTAATTLAELCRSVGIGISGASKGLREKDKHVTRGGHVLRRVELLKSNNMVRRSGF